MIRSLALAREALLAARSQPVASTLTVLVVASMIVAVMLTSGRSAAAEQEVLGSIDSAGTRSIVIRAEDSAGLTSSALSRIATISGIEWMGAFSNAIDATNEFIPDGARSPVRLAYGSQFRSLGVPSRTALPGELAYASAEAMAAWGLRDGAGTITLSSGDTFAVAGSLQVPDYLAVLEPLAVIPKPEVTGGEPISVIVVIASRPDLVGPVSASVTSVLGAEDPTKVTVQTSERLAQLSALVEGQLGSFSRGLVLALLLVSAALVAMLLYGLVMMRRKDFGRRRALGATRSLIIALLITQTSILAAAGALAGVGVSVLVLASTRAALPGLEFVGGLSLLAVATAALAALVPALVASRREPIRELRVP